MANSTNEKARKERKGKERQELIIAKQEILKKIREQKMYTLKLAVGYYLVSVV